MLYPERMEPRGDRFSFTEFSDLKALKSYFPINPSYSPIEDSSVRFA